MFGIGLVSVSFLLHAYLFWRLGTMPLLARVPRWIRWAAGGLLWLLVAVGRLWAHGAAGTAAAGIELVAMNWLATAFLATLLLHGGQIWPLGALVRLRYPLVHGLHEVGGMRVFVSRGAGSWGPRMRLWRPGEIVKLTLRARVEGPEQALGRTTTG